MTFQNQKICKITEGQGKEKNAQFTNGRLLETETFNQID